jgi:hypothetical protein
MSWAATCEKRGSSTAPPARLICAIHSFAGNINSFEGGMFSVRDVKSPVYLSSLKSMPKHYLYCGRQNMF